MLRYSYICVCANDVDICTPFAKDQRCAVFVRVDKGAVRSGFFPDNIYNFAAAGIHALPAASEIYIEPAGSIARDGGDAGPQHQNIGNAYLPST